MFVRSMFILQSLQHRSIIKFVNYIISPDDSIIYLLFEACKKGSLDKLKQILLERKQYRIIKYVLYQLAEALIYMKSNDVAHRDIKPSNITFNNCGQLKVIDFDQAVWFQPQFPNNNQMTMLKDFGISIQTKE